MVGNALDTVRRAPSSYTKYEQLLETGTVRPLGQQTGGRPLGSSFRRPRTHTLMGNRLPFLVLRWLAPWEKEGRSLAAGLYPVLFLGTNFGAPCHAHREGEGPVSLGY